MTTLFNTCHLVRSTTPPHQEPHNLHDSFDSSDDEPLAKYKASAGEQKTDGNNAEPEEPADMDKLPVRGVGRPKGKAQPLRIDFSRPKSIKQHNVWRDQVDEECKRLGIYYRCWHPLNPQQTSHITVRDFSDSTVIPAEQEIPQWCVICPKNRYIRNRFLGRQHYLRVHHKPMLVVADSKMWACKCSEVRSHGSDNSARNQHFHCYICYHPFKRSDLLGTHLITQHIEVDDIQVRHLMDDSNPHKEPL